MWVQERAEADLSDRFPKDNRSTMTQVPKALRGAN
jgi:hypothetical protein